MRTAIVRVAVSTHRTSDNDVRRGRASLAEIGYEFLPAHAPVPSATEHEIAFVLDGDDSEALSSTAIAAARQAFGEGVRAGPVTFLSRGTNDDARGIAAALGVTAEVTRTVGDDGEVVVVHVQAADLRGVPESRLHTALEAALNAEVRIVAAPEASE